MASLEEIRNERLKKVDLLREKGISPYPIFSVRDFSIEEAIVDFTKLSKRKKSIYLVGRITALRGQGALIFFDLNDGTAVMQGLLKKDEIEEDKRKFFAETVDVGDFIEVKGSFFVT